MNRGEFTRAVLIRLSAPIDGMRLAFGVAWAAYESTDAKNNPWATTEKVTGSTKFNDDGVQNYETFEQGVDATVATLLQVPYAQLVRDLRNPDASLRELRGALNASPWGSRVTLLSWQGVVRDYDANNIEVPGSGGDTPVPVAKDTPVVTSSVVETPKEAEVAPEVAPEEETTSVPAPVEEVDTLEAREAKAAALEVTAEVATSEETKSPEAIATSAVETPAEVASFKEKVVAAGKDFLAALERL